MTRPPILDYHPADPSPSRLPIRLFTVGLLAWWIVLLIKTADEPLTLFVVLPNFYLILVRSTGFLIAIAAIACFDARFVRLLQFLILLFFAPWAFLLFVAVASLTVLGDFSPVDLIGPFLSLPGITAGYLFLGLFLSARFFVRPHLPLT